MSQSPATCPDGERDLHLQAFISSFVVPSRRERATYLMLTAKGRARGNLNQILGWLRPDLRTSLRGLAGVPQHLEHSFGTQRGVYVANRMTTALMLSPAEAACKASEDFSDAMLSIEPGRLVLIFYDEPFGPDLFRL